MKKFCYFFYCYCFCFLFAQDTVTHPLKPLEPFNQPFIENHNNAALKHKNNEWVYHSDDVSLQDGSTSHDGNYSTRMGNISIFESQPMDVFTETNSSMVGNRVFHESVEIPYFLPDTNER